MQGAIAAAFLITAAAAQARTDERVLMSDYAKARFATEVGEFGQASAGFAAALAANPASDLIASRALSHAIAAGDWPLALNAARTLERANALAPDSRLVLMAHALRARDWRAASAQIDGIEQVEAFAFMAPILRAWVALGSRQGDPVQILDNVRAQPLTAAYAGEHRALILLAMNRREGAQELLALIPSAGPRAARLRIAGASLLADRRDREAALALLQGEEPPVAAARRMVEARHDLPGAVSTPAHGVSELFSRLAIDLTSQNAGALGLNFARLATFLAPENSETWLIAAELLGAQDKPRAGLALLGNIRSDDPFAASARDLRVRLLMTSGQKEAALAEARQVTAGPAASASDWLTLGQLYSELDRHGEAAEAFSRASALVGEGSAAMPAWTFWLLRGGALDEAGNWPEAKAALERAYQLAPTQPLVLNYLGYAQIARRENVQEAESLIREASRLAPDNAAITDSLGWAYYLRGDYPRAVELLERAAQGEPADVEINEHLGDAYYAMGRRIEARFAWRAALVYAEGADAQRLAAKLETGLTPQLAAR